MNTCAYKLGSRQHNNTNNGNMQPHVGYCNEKVCRSFSILTSGTNNDLFNFLKPLLLTLSTHR